MNRLRRAPRLLALPAVLALLGGCGLSEDSGPQAIAPENLPTGLLEPNPVSSTTLPKSPGTTSVTVYFLERVGDSERLVEVKREVKNPSEPGERIAALFSQPTPAETERGLTTSIPADTVLINTKRTPGSDELVVDLSNELTSSIEGVELTKAFAQIVWTMTEPDGGLRRVRFLVDGEEIRAPDAEGVEKEGAVTRDDYDALEPR